MIDDQDNVDFISSNVNSSRQEAMLHVFEDNEAVIKMIIKGRSPTMRHVPRNSQSCAWLVVRSNQFGPQSPNQIKHIDTKKQTRRPTDKGESHTWRMESSFVFVQHQPFQIHPLSWSDVEKTARRCRWRNSHSKIEADERNLYGLFWVGLLWKRQFEKMILKYGLEKVPNWECEFVIREKVPSLSVYVDDIKLAGKKQNTDPMWKILMKDVDLREPTSLLHHVHLDLHSTRMRNEQRYFGQLQKHVWIQNFCWSYRKATLFREIGCEDFLTVLWYGRSCEEMCGTILWTGEQNNSTPFQSRNSMYWRPSIQRRRIGICWRIVKSMLTNCSEMSVFSSSWETWYLVVSEQTCTIRHKNGPKLETKAWIGWFHTFITHVNTNNIAMSETLPNNADWTVSRLRFCVRSWGVKIYSWRNFVQIRKSYICSNKLDVQETDFCFTQFCRSWGDFSRCKFTHGWDSRSRSLGFSDWSISFLTKPNQQNQRYKRATGHRVGTSSIKHAKTKSNHEHQSRPDQYWSRSIKRNTFWFQCYVVLCLWG